MKLSRYEQEVVINFNVGEDKATVYSVNPAWCRKMDALAKEFPEAFRLTEQTKVSRTYECPKRLIRIAKPRELSSAQRENLSRMRANRGKKPDKATD